VRAGIVGWGSLDETRGFFLDVVEETLAGSLARTAERVDAGLAAALREVEQSAADPILRAVAGRDAAGRAVPRSALHTALARTGGDGGSLDALWLVGPDGAVRASHGPPPYARELGRGLLAPGLHEVLHDGRTHALAVAPVARSEDGVGAWLVGRIDDRVFLRALPPDSLPGIGRGYVLDADGGVLFAGATEPAGDATLPLEPVPGAGPFEYRASDGSRRLASLQPLEHLGWHVAVVAQLDRGFQPVLPLLWRILLLDSVIVLLLAALAYRLTDRIVRPVWSLWHGARRIANGDRTVEVSEPPGHDEIGELTRTFNAMARTLREDEVEIEAAQRQLRTQNRALQAANEVLAQLSITDGLTKLHNHRFFQDHLTRELKRVGRSGEPLAMLLIDIDDFKRLNDRYGHSTGDAILVRLGQVMNANVRENDLLARYGGEEFVVLASADLEGAIALAEKLRMAVLETPILVDEALRLTHVSISIGVALYRGDRKAFFLATDRALYRAKAEGKNCVVADEESSHADDPAMLPG
jgi:diguanylate cyclase (GGDEF)-like protein